MHRSSTPSRSRAGSAPAALVFWVLGLLILIGPFACKGGPDRPDWGAEDPTRKTTWTSDEDESPLDLPFADDLAGLAEAAQEEDWGLEVDPVAFVTEASEARFGWGGEALAHSGLFQAWRLEPGRRMYVRECAGCHALTGDGAGPAARHLEPRPRNFRRRHFKFQSAPVGGRPKRDDLLRTVTLGLVGSAMPDFRLLPLERRHDLVEYVRYLAIRGEFEQTMLDLSFDEQELADPDEVMEIVVERWVEENNPSTYPSVPETAYDRESVERGRAIFNGPAACNGCHGDTGLGDGPTANDFNDGWGYPIRPRDLTTGLFRAGDQPEDLYRVVANGIGGTPMPGAIDNNTPEEVWDIVHFIQFLAGRELSE